MEEHHAPKDGQWERTRIEGSAGASFSSQVQDRFGKQILALSAVGKEPKETVAIFFSTDTYEGWTIYFSPGCVHIAEPHLLGHPAEPCERPDVDGLALLAEYGPDGSDTWVECFGRAPSRIGRVART